MPKLTKPGFAGSGKQKMTLCVNLTDTCMFFTASAVKALSFKEKGLLSKSHFLNSSVVGTNVSIIALKGPEVVRKFNEKFRTKNSPFRRMLKKIKLRF